MIVTLDACDYIMCKKKEQCTVFAYNLLLVET